MMRDSNCTRLRYIEAPPMQICPLWNVQLLLAACIHIWRKEALQCTALLMRVLIRLLRTAGIAVDKHQFLNHNAYP